MRLSGSITEKFCPSGMSFVPQNPMFEATLRLLPKTTSVPLSSIDRESAKIAVQRAAMLVRLVAKEFPSQVLGDVAEASSLGGDQSRPAASGRGDIEWLRLPKKGGCPHTGMSRSYLYGLITPSEENGYHPPVKSIALRKRGNIRGIRLISYDSLMEYLAAEAAIQNPER